MSLQISFQDKIFKTLLSLYGGISACSFVGFLALYAHSFKEAFLKHFLTWKTIVAKKLKAFFVVE
eukprot:UN07140